MTSMRTSARKTKQLSLVWQAIKDDKSHPTADQIYARVRRKLPNISLGTVYRNLQKLVGSKKLQVLMLGRSQHFDPLVQRHQHFICEVCDRVFDVLVDAQREIRPAKLPEEGFTVTSHQLAFYGTCKTCSS
ncbi:MAG TPA: transcriptional repressor [Candidatus Limnocylindrales bacterium]|nr:transcriptional repressor [Candidatus Limnocylindrales bacterium]